MTGGRDNFRLTSILNLDTILSLCESVTKMLKINILSVTEDPRELSADIPPQDLGLDGEEVRLLGPVKLSCEFYRMGQKIMLRGRFDARVELTCSRCLTVFQAPLQGPIELVAVPAETVHPAPQSADQELQEEDVSLMTYTGDQLDLIPEIRTALLLALPMKPLCEENCQGLCPSCGNRMVNGDHCHCGQVEPQTPFSALKRLKNNPPSAN